MLPVMPELQVACHALMLATVHLALMVTVSTQLGVFKLVIRVLQPTAFNVMLISGYASFVIMAIEKLELPVKDVQ